MNNDISFIVVAAGKGLRMGEELPKQFLLLFNRPMLAYTLDAIHNAMPSAEIILALHPDFIDYWREQITIYNISVPHKIVAGGEERFSSVKNAINATSANSKYLLIHDGVRPFVTTDVIFRILNALNSHSAVVPVIPMVDSLRMRSGDNTTIIVDRSLYLGVQTPQGFHRDTIINGYDVPFSNSFTDDASVVEKAGIRVECVEGSKINIKITTPEDISYAKFLIECNGLKK